MSALLPNLLSHRRHKNGVEIEVEIRTANPLDAEEFEKAGDLIAVIDALFDAIPDQPAGEGR